MKPVPNEIKNDRTERKMSDAKKNKNAQQKSNAARKKNSINVGNKRERQLTTDLIYSIAE